MIRLTATFVALLTLGFASAGAQTLKGDPQAVAAAERMIDRLGGKDVWADARSLYLEYHGWRTDPPEPVVERAWRDLTQPYQHMAFEGRSFETKFSMTPQRSWLERVSGNRQFSAEEHAQNIAFFDFDFYTIIRNLAAGDERITLKVGDDGRILIEGPAGADWGWFEIDGTGQPVRWGASYGGEPLEYLYGPVKAYGNINFPAWGTASDGSWRFDYVIVDVSRDAVPMTLKPPRK